MVLLFLAGSQAGAQTADTLFTERSFFDASDAVLLGGFTVATIAAAPADRWVTRQLQDEARQANRTLSRGATAFRVFGYPGTLVTSGLIYAAGIASGNRRTEDLGLHALESGIVAVTITSATKIIAGRARPDVSKDNARNFKLFRGWHNDNYQSFPSGHTTAAFAFASVISAESSHWWPDSRWVVGPVLYGAATLTGVSRIYNNRHWASDVLAGAAVGTLTGIKVFRYQHSHPDNWLDRKLLRAGVSVSNTGLVMPVLSVVRQ